MNDLDGYLELIEMGQPDLIEIKGVTYCGKSDASTLTMENCPWHYEVCSYCEMLVDRLNKRAKGPEYQIATGKYIYRLYTLYIIVRILLVHTSIMSITYIN